MPPEGIGKRPNAAPADERHDNIDRVCGGNLGAELMPDCRLPRGIREDRRIEQRREWTLDCLRSPIRKLLQQRNQHLPRVERHIALEIVSAIR
jgi:hypothetical protein